MFTLEIVLLLIIAHLLGDFFLQDEKWATTKSYDFKSLIKHAGLYSLLFSTTLSAYFWVSPMMGVFNDVMFFTFVTFVTHTTIDFFSSKLTRWMYLHKKFGSSIPNWGFFTVIGIDQTLHFAQLFLTYKIIFL